MGKTSYTAITDLHPDKIQEINAFLVANKKQNFSLAQLSFIRNMDELDVIGLSQGYSGIRGYFLKYSNRDFNRDKNGKTCDTLLNDFMDSLNEDDYSSSDLENLKKVQRDLYKAEIVQYGLVLTSSHINRGLTVLYLNKKCKPLYIRHVIHQ